MEEQSIEQESAYQREPDGSRLRGGAGLRPRQAVGCQTGKERS